VKDVAAQQDSRGIELQKVGIKDFHLPLNIKRKQGSYSSALGIVDMSVELAEEHRATHMSRFVEILLRWQNQPIAEAELKQIAREAAEVFSARNVYLRTRFKYFLDKLTPATNIPCALDYDCSFSCRYNASTSLGVEPSTCSGREQAERSLSNHEGDDFVLGVEVPVILVCPCSLEISDFGAHSQRAVIGARLRYEEGTIVWIEDLVPLLEKSGSCEIFPLLKREDEKLVTERAFSNPKFVEDAVRDSFLALRQLPNVTWFEVCCESAESIHNHSAHASVSWQKQG